MKRVPKVHVIGAGVIGLTTATLLLIEGYDVTILAKHFPGDMSIDYTSPWAGARWKTLAPNDDARLQRYDADSFKIFWELAKCRADETGIMVIPAFDYYKDPTADQRNPWWKKVVPGFRKLSRKELPKNIDIGYTFTTVAITPDRYLRWLQSQFVALGGKRKQVEISNLTDAMDDHQNTVDIIVNCAGMHATSIQGVNDSHVNNPVRGQNVVVRAKHIRKTISVKTKQEYTYVIPRADGTVILGTTKDEGNRNAEPDPAIAKDIMERACKHCPELTNGKGIERLDVVGNIIGLRPKRNGGPRVETEVKESPSGKPILVAHNYGHDGSGYQASWGSAKHAVKLIKEHHETLQAQSSKIQELLSRL
ncbi:nucleotide-binding domain-containing protein [Lichtheimia hyalospora FSU 10163]|nr:nucleotide-binding domain-containing protein [Lichtheimia hyalospora FSU 10163]